MLPYMIGDIDLWPVRVDVVNDYLDQVAAWSTLAAAMAATLALLAAGVAARRAGEAAIAANEQAKAANELLDIERKRQDAADESAKRVQAELVAVWVDYENRRVVIRNASNQPIYDVLLFATPRPQLAHSLSKRIEVIPPPPAAYAPLAHDGLTRNSSFEPPANEIWWSPPTPIENTYDSGRYGADHPVMIAMEERADSDPDQPEPNGQGVNAAIKFRDQTGRGWLRAGNGSLSENPDHVSGPVS